MNEKLQLLKKWTETSSMKRPSVEIIDSIEVALRDLGPSTKREPVKRKVIEELQRLQASGRTDAEKREIISYMYWMFPTLPEKWLAHVFSWGSICKVWEWINPLSSVVCCESCQRTIKIQIRSRFDLYDALGCRWPSRYCEDKECKAKLT